MASKAYFANDSTSFVIVEKVCNGLSVFPLADVHIEISGLSNTIAIPQMVRSR
jgi:hypothetical protein